MHFITFKRARCLSLSFSFYLFFYAYCWCWYATFVALSASGMCVWMGKPQEWCAANGKPEHMLRQQSVSTCLCCRVVCCLPIQCLAVSCVCDARVLPRARWKTYSALCCHMLRARAECLIWRERERERAYVDIQLISCGEQMAILDFSWNERARCFFYVYFNGGRFAVCCKSFGSIFIFLLDSGADIATRLFCVSIDKTNIISLFICRIKKIFWRLKSFVCSKL